MADTTLHGENGSPQPLTDTRTWAVLLEGHMRAQKMLNHHFDSPTSKTPDDAEFYDAVTFALGDEALRAERVLINTPAPDLSGLLAKVRAIAQRLQDDDDVPQCYGEPLLADLNRLVQA